MEFKNQPIYKGVHKTLCTNFRACAAFTLQTILLSLHQVKNCPTKSADGSRFLVIGKTVVESSAYLKRTGQPLKKISKSFKNILKRYGPLTLPCVVPLLTNFQCPKKL